LKGHKIEDEEVKLAEFWQVKNTKKQKIRLFFNASLGQ
jgi:hypothetical protein